MGASGTTTLQTEYDDAGRTTATIDALGHRAETTYDGADRVVATVVKDYQLDPGVSTTRDILMKGYQYDPAGHVVTTIEGDVVRTEVRDTGVGIAEADIPRLFQRFQQLDMSLERRAGGAGLGLSIAKAMVEAHGGAIGVESRPGEGATFWFTLPLAPAPALQPA